LIVEALPPVFAPSFIHLSFLVDLVILAFASFFRLLVLFRILAFLAIFGGCFVSVIAGFFTELVFIFEITLEPLFPILTPPVVVVLPPHQTVTYDRFGLVAGFLNIVISRQIQVSPILVDVRYA